MIQSLLGNKLMYFRNNKSLNKNITKLSINGNTVTDVGCIAEEMNNYFCNIGFNTAQSITTMPSKSSSHYLSNSIKSSFYCNNIDPK